MEKEEVKIELFEQCLELIDNKIQHAEKVLGHSNGHPQADIQKKLADYKRARNMLSLINPTKMYEIAGLGAVVVTPFTNYFIAIAGGRIFAGAEKFFVIARDSHLAQEMQGKKTGDKIKFNNQSIEIIDIY